MCVRQAIVDERNERDDVETVNRKNEIGEEGGDA